MSKSCLYLVIAFLGGCTSSVPSIPIPDAGSDAVAVVNGVPITNADVEIAMRRGGQHGSETKQGDPKAIIETLVNAELVRQAAVKKGLDKLPEHQVKLRQLFAQFMAAQRAELSDVFFAQEVVAKATVTDDEARAHFDRHVEQLRNEYHVLQILIKKDEAAIEEIKKTIDGGASFDEVVAKRFADVPVGASRPWDLGFLRWSQLPTEWREEIDRLQPGQVSGIIKGAGQRFWILKLVDKRVNASLTFEAEKPIVVEMLQRVKVEEARASAMEELRNRAQISYPGGAHP